MSKPLSSADRDAIEEYAATCFDTLKQLRVGVGASAYSRGTKEEIRKASALEFCEHLEIHNVCPHYLLISDVLHEGNEIAKIDAVPSLWAAKSKIVNILTKPDKNAEYDKATRFQICLTIYPDGVPTPMILQVVNLLEIDKQKFIGMEHDKVYYELPWEIINKPFESYQEAK